MNKLYHFDSEAGLYRSDAAVVWCFDARFTLAVEKFLKRRAIARADSIRVAGGAKSLASPREESERGFIVDQLRLSRKLHGAERVILFAHADCGAYGGLAAFNGDPVVEAENHRRELARASDWVRRAVPDMPVECFFVDFSGVWEVESVRAAGN